VARAVARKQGFVYKARSPDKIKERSSRTSGKFLSIFKPGIDVFKSKQGDNLTRYLPPTWDDAEHYGYSVFVHRNVGPDSAMVVCPQKMLGKPCAVCEEVKILKKAGEDVEAKEIDVSERIVSWILDRDADDPEKPIVWDQSWTQDRDISALCVNDRTGEILMIDHPDNGYDVSFKRTGTGMKKTKYYGWAIDRESTPIHDKERVQDEILDYIAENPIPSTLQIFDYDYLKGMLSGTVVEKDADLDNDQVQEEEPPFEGGSRRGARKPEPDDDRPQISRGGSRRPVEEPVDEEVDEETGEVTEVRRPVRTASVRPSGGRRVIEETDEDTSPPPPARNVSRGRVR
jgi:hypothetical protein